MQAKHAKQARAQVQQALEDNEEGDRMSARTKKGMMLEGE
jgi:hypothetical protein